MVKHVKGGQRDEKRDEDSSIRLDKGFCGLGLGSDKFSELDRGELKMTIDERIVEGLKHVESLGVRLTHIARLTGVDSTAISKVKTDPTVMGLEKKTRLLKVLEQYESMGEK